MMMSGYDFSKQACLLQANVIYQKILTLFAQCSDYFYIIYQPNDIETELSTHLAKKSGQRFLYNGYQIQYTPGLILLNLDDERDQIILKESILSHLSSMHPHAIFTAKPRYIYGWVYSPFSIEKLAAQLGYVAIQKQQDGEELLRYFDPAVLSSLTQILKDYQKEKLLCPISYWLYANGDGELIVEENSRAVRKHHLPHLSLSLEQWQKIHWIEVRNQTLLRYRLNFMTENRVPEFVADKLIYTALEDAISYGYHSKLDLIEYAYRALTVYPKFIEHQTISQMIKKSPYTSLVDQLSPLSQKEWDTLTQEQYIKITGAIS